MAPGWAGFVCCCLGFVMKLKLSTFVTILFSILFASIPVVVVTSELSSGLSRSLVFLEGVLNVRAEWVAMVEVFRYEGLRV